MTQSQSARLPRSSSPSALRNPSWNSGEIERSAQGFARRSIILRAALGPTHTHETPTETKKSAANNQPLNPQSKTQHKTAPD